MRTRRRSTARTRCPKEPERKALPPPPSDASPSPPRRRSWAWLWMLLLAAAGFVATARTRHGRAEGLLPAAGHRTADGLDRRRAGHLFSGDAAEAGLVHRHRAVGSSRCRTSGSAGAAATRSISTLNTWSQRLMQEMRSLPGMRDVNTDRQNRGQELDVQIDRATAARLGVSASAIDAALYDASASAMSRQCADR